MQLPAFNNSLCFKCVNGNNSAFTLKKETLCESIKHHVFKYVEDDTPNCELNSREILASIVNENMEIVAERHALKRGIF